MGTADAAAEQNEAPEPPVEPLGGRLRLVPYRNTKVIHLIRHGQGYHNAAGHRDATEYGSSEWLDAHLTKKGWQQAWACNRHIRALGGTFRADLVVVSPLVRTLETAAGVFGAGRWCQVDEPQPPLMLEQEELPGKRAAHHAISAAGCPPMVAWEGCREHLGQNPCDKRHPMAQTSPHFPAVDFSLIEDDEDVLWELEHRESKAEIMERGLRFTQWLLSRPEHHIAVVSHSSFIFFWMQAYGHSAAPGVQDVLHKWYDNCEMRTVVLADEGGTHVQHDSFHFRGGIHI